MEKNYNLLNIKLYYILKADLKMKNKLQSCKTKASFENFLTKAYKFIKKVLTIYHKKSMMKLKINDYINLGLLLIRSGYTLINYKKYDIYFL